MLITYEFYRHDISASHVDPAIKFILEACIAENDADRHITNIKVSYIYKILTLTHLASQGQSFSEKILFGPKHEIH